LPVAPYLTKNGVGSSAPILARVLASRSFT
jgi:hypothetical protein